MWNIYSQLTEKANEYKMPLCIAFVNYEKTFDSVEMNVVLKSLEKKAIKGQYIKLL